MPPIPIEILVIKVPKVSIKIHQYCKILPPRNTMLLWLFDNFDQMYFLKIEIFYIFHINSNMVYNSDAYRTPFLRK